MLPPPHCCHSKCTTSCLELASEQGRGRKREGKRKYKQLRFLDILPDLQSSLFLIFWLEKDSFFQQFCSLYLTCNSGIWFTLKLNSSNKEGKKKTVKNKHSCHCLLFSIFRKLLFVFCPVVLVIIN